MSPFLSKDPFDTLIKIATWKYHRTVYLDCHVVLDKNHYSCPYQYVGKKVDLRITDSLVEIYHKSERIATHHWFPEYLSNQWATVPEHMPDQFQHMEWDDQRILKWAKTVGTSACEVVDRIFASVRIKEQGNNSCLAVLRLSKKYTPSRLEAACALALTRFHSPPYRHLSAILSAKKDISFQQQRAQEQRESEQAEQGYLAGLVRLRGA